MNRKAPLTMLAVLVGAGVVFANAGPAPLPKGRKVVEPPVRFEGIDKHPDHVFHAYYCAVYFGCKLVEAKEGESIKLSFKGDMFKGRVPTTRLWLLAMDRKEFEKRKNDDPSLKWLTDTEKKQGVLWAEMKAPDTTAPETVKEVPVTTYRVTIKDGKLTGTKVEEKKSSALEPLLPPWTIGLVGSLSLVWLGLWFARRGQRP
ncbi:MAG: hypothetical protein HY289_04770 [Planctomycetes bacterium]|nr:hypothetical protein [Planctomycetota bacterium]